MSGEKMPLEVCSNFLFPKIFRTFRMAVHPTRLLIAFAAVAVTCLAGWVMDFSQTVVVAPEAQGHITELQVYLTQPERVPLHIDGYKTTGDRKGVFATLWWITTSKFQGAVDSLFKLNLPAVAANIAEYFNALCWAFRYHFVYCIIFAFIKLTVISIAGGCLCRLAATEFARAEQCSLPEAIQFSRKNFTTFFAVPLAPIAIVIFIGLFLSLLGLIVNISFAGELILGILTPFTLMAGALITIILIGTAAGFNLMFPAVAYDGSDCFDAISRALSYIYTKPWKMGFYTVIAAVYGAICYTSVRFCAFLALLVTHIFLQLGVLVDNSSGETNKLTAIWPEPYFKNLSGFVSMATTNWTESAAAFLVHLALLAIIGLLTAFIISFYFSANTIIYALMRNRVDNTPLEDIYTSSQTAGPAPQPKAEEAPT
jgi:hypothetical protein